MTFEIQNAIRAVKRLLLASALASLCIAPADAAWLSADGPLATLRGDIEAGDASGLRALLAAHPEIRVLALDSPGGGVRAGMALGDLVRSARLATVVDADRASCDSACTLVFAAGVSRHYLNAERLRAGTSGLYGLGYHRARAVGSRVEPPKLSMEGEALAARYYRRMGSPGAVAMMARGTITSLYRPDAQTALRLGLATSLSPPDLSRPSSRRTSGSRPRARAFSRSSPAN